MRPCRQKHARAGRAGWLSVPPVGCLQEIEQHSSVWGNVEHPEKETNPYMLVMQLLAQSDHKLSIKQDLATIEDVRRLILAVSFWRRSTSTDRPSDWWTSRRQRR